MLRILFASLLLVSAISSYAQSKTTVFSCDTCDYNGALDIAKIESPPLECHNPTSNDPWSMPEAPNVDDEVCDAGKKEFIVANPITQKAYKFLVISYPVNPTGRERDISIRDLNISSTEQVLLQDFYNLDRDFRESINSISRSRYTRSFNYAFPDHQAEPNCNSHPLYIMGKRGLTQDMLDSFSRQIANKVGNRSWESFVRETVVSGLELTVSRGGLSLGVKLTHNNKKTYISHRINADNFLRFSIDYYGSEINDGKRELFFNYTFLPGVSKVDGLNFSFVQEVNADLSGTKVSECFKKYFQEKASETQKRVYYGGGNFGPTIPDLPNHDSNLNGRMCEYKITTFTGVPGDLKKQIVTFFAQC